MSWQDVLWDENGPIGIAFGRSEQFGDPAHAAVCVSFRQSGVMKFFNGDGELIKTEQTDNPHYASNHTRLLFGGL